MFKREKSRSLPRDGYSNRELPSEPTVNSTGGLSVAVVVCVTALYVVVQFMWLCCRG